MADQVLPRQVRIGDITAEVDGVDLRSVRVGDVEVLNRLYVALRDEGWAAIDADVTITYHDLTDNAFRFEWTADHRPRVPLSWKGRLILDPDGLELEVVGRAEAEVVYNRFGVCVLHPLTQAGATLRINTPAGARDTILPRDVAPQRLCGTGPTPAIGPFSALSIEAPPGEISWTFEGDLFELEDQRNWTDASFKTYSTPLTLPRPHRIGRGETVRQRVRMRIGRGTAARDVAEHQPPTPRRCQARIGAVVPVGASTEPRTVAVAVREVGLDVVRLETAAPAADAQRLSDLSSAAREAGASVELAILGNDAITEHDVARAVDNSLPDLLLMFHGIGRSGEADECSSPGLIAMGTRAVQSAGRPVPVGGGTLFNFCELQRNPLSGMQAVAFAVCPTVHAADIRSILETPASVDAILRTLRSIVDDVPIIVGPLLARERGPAPGMRPSPGAFDVSMLPPGWVSAMTEALDRAGADTIQTLAVDALVDVHGHLTPHAEALREYGAGRRRQAVN